MYKKLLVAAACMAGAASIAQADTIVTPANSIGYQAGHFMKVARVFLGYDQFGRPVYGHRHLPRQIIGYNRYGRPIYGVIYNNEPVAPALAIFNSIVRPYNNQWNWRHRHWDRGEHRGGDYGEHHDRDHRDHRD
jgi:hypothetical protein